MRHMGRFTEFAEELEKRIRREVEKEFQARNPSSFTTSKSAITPEFPSEIDSLPTGFSWIVGEGLRVHITHQNSKQGHSAYGVKPRPPRPPHSLSEIQKSAFDFFRKMKVELEDNFSLQDLRRAWRKLALKCHPDQGGSAEMFRSAQSAYQKLQTVCE